MKLRHSSIDVNNLYLYQQIVIMIFACIATPIFINTVVVFVRLYWFEKRFQHVVLEAQKFRRTKDKSRTKSQAKGDDNPDMEQEERGVGGRKIVVMHPGDRTMSVAQHHMSEKDADPESEETSAQSSSVGTLPATQDPSFEDHGPLRIDTSTKPANPDEDPANEPRSARPNRAITFADETGKDPKRLAPARRRSESGERFPSPRSPDQHVSFLMRQRQQSHDRPLFIPGPRDFDKGHGPEEIDEDDDITLSRTNTRAGGMLPARRNSSDGDESGDDNGKSAFRTRLKNKLSLEDAGNALHKARTGVMARFRHPANQDEPSEEEEIEKVTEPSRDTDEVSSPTSLRRRGRVSTFTSFLSTRQDDPDPMPYLSYQATIGRNSAFVDLTEEQREELGGIEYRSLKTLAVILVCYFVGFHLLGMVCLTPWIVNSRRYSNVVREDGQSPIFWGFFTSASLFNDLGLTLTPDSMISFQYAVWPLLLGSFLIVIGNTGFPCMLRFVIWFCSKVVPQSSSVWEEYRFLLDHPRRCFTLLFPSNANWWLFWVLVLLNGIDLLFFIILDVRANPHFSATLAANDLNSWAIPQ